MVVAADIGDPAGLNGPLHPIYKQEVARRAGIAADRLVKGNSTVPANGPQPVGVVWDAWHSDWGNFHNGTHSSVCASPPWFCGGVRIRFDQPIRLLPGSQAARYGGSGLRLWNGQMGTMALGGASVGDPQLLSALCIDCSKCPCAQPVEVTGVLGDGHTLQLNVSFYSGVPSFVKYAWQDYPVMFIHDDLGHNRPVNHT